MAAWALAGCGKRPAKPPSGTTRHHYGELDDQFGDLFLPKGDPRGTVVLLHGGFWLSDYGLDLMSPIGRALAQDGWAAWNLEYRRLDAGGGWPTTFEDVAAGVDHLTKLGIDPEPVVVLGHSAGGQLAAWAASRSAQTPGGASKVGICGVVSLSGVLDLAGGARDNVGNGAIERLMGGSPDEVPERYRLGDPVELVPAAGPVACVRGSQDDVVPAAQSKAYVRAARAAGADASLTTVAGDHFTIIDPHDQAWATTVRLVTGLAGG